MFREESILARAKQVLGIEEASEAIIKKNFRSRIVKFHPDKKGALFKKQAKVLLEAYNVLLGKIKPLECKLLE
jgi:DnaJ-class molecular chaperone